MKLNQFVPSSGNGPLPSGCTTILWTAGSGLLLSWLCWSYCQSNGNFSALALFSNFHNADKKQYIMKDLGTLPKSHWTEAAAINDNAEIAGHFSSAVGDGYDQAIVCSGGIITLVPFPLPAGKYEEQPSSYATSINSQGNVCGWISAPPAAYRAFIFSNGRTDVIPPSLSYDMSSALSVNDKGEVTGEFAVRNGASQAFIYNRKGIRLIPGLTKYPYTVGYSINNIEQVVGSASQGAASSAQHSHAFLYEDGHTTDLGTLDGAPDSCANSINSSGEIVGTSGNDAIPTTQQAFLFAHGKMTDLLSKGSRGCYSATSINSNDEVVGFMINTSNDSHAVLYRNGKALDLNDLVDDNRGWTLTRAVGINDSGGIAVIGVRGNETHSFLLVPLNRHRKF